MPIAIISIGPLGYIPPPDPADQISVLALLAKEVNLSESGAIEQIQPLERVSVLQQPFQL